MATAATGMAAHDYKLTPYWWDQAPAPELPGTLPSGTVDVAIVGSGYTGLNAAIETARGGRSTLVLDAEDAGWGCSSRNGGHISTSIKPSLAELSARYGAERGRAIRNEGKTALDWIESLVGREDIDCDFKRCGRFHAAHAPENFGELVETAATVSRDEGIEAHVVPRAEQHRHLGTDAYYGGVYYPRHASLHPAKYHRGLIASARAAGATILPHTPVLAIERSGKEFRLATPRGTVTARDVIVATNGYSGNLVPWLSRRLIPIGSYIIATDPLPKATMDRLFPNDHTASDTCRVVYYYRASPDRSRIVFGGRVSSSETDPRVSAPRLHRQLVRIFPELAGTGISHSWMGFVAYSFDHLAHCGEHEGIHYAASYCGSGVSMASYLGMRAGQRVLGKKEGKTAFDGLPFPTRPLYTGKPWFLPAVVAWYAWRDRQEIARARRNG